MRIVDNFADGFADCPAHDQQTAPQTAMRVTNMLGRLHRAQQAGTCAPSHTRTARRPERLEEWLP